jgi:hypothetical protein
MKMEYNILGCNVIHRPFLNFRFQTLEELKSHRFEVHLQKSFVCTVCKKVFKKSNYLFELKETDPFQLLSFILRYSLEENTKILKNICQAIGMGKPRIQSSVWHVVLLLRSRITLRSTFLIGDHTIMGNVQPARFV